MQKMIIRSEKRSDRQLVKARLRQLGVKVIHDSGHRLMVIEAPDDLKEIEGRLPGGTELISPDKASPKMARKEDEHDLLFAKALKLRQSKAYRELKAGQTPGESPEEQEIFSATCMEEEE